MTRKSLGECAYFKFFLYFHRKDSSQRRQHNSDDEHVKGSDMYHIEYLYWHYMPSN
ncbi:hypothetical protein Pint_27475 [Pistacia integerrima]|uniref:Uncharacterized protein n=1 Tax=Pistacia integerrima TaxID=434235 RepID=A0ACC0YQ95_9ROSI|nr:hypothetical protein Pint_27475 [Pistacia integerrima]